MSANSTINTTNIDETFPVPGQDNDSQGFRTNFTSIKDNLDRARDEITDLRNKVVLKAPLVGQQSVDNDLSNEPMLNASLETVFLNRVHLPEHQTLLNANAATVDLSKTITEFNNSPSSSGTATASLAAGAPGLIKILSLDGDNDDVEITVTNPGWSGSGLVTLTDSGNACVLVYINEKWVCIGNNGAVFS